MLINTKYLGEVEIETSEILSFHHGLLGFQEYKEFILLPLDADLPLALLQSTEEVSIGFIVALPFAFKQDYAFDLSDEDKYDLQIEKEEDVLTYSIVTLNETFADSTINLLAPVVININKKIGKQIVLQDNKEYSLRFPIKQTVGSAK
mgnify:FL=1